MAASLPRAVHVPEQAPPIETTLDIVGQRFLASFRASSQKLVRALVDAYPHEAPNALEGEALLLLSRLLFLFFVQEEGWLAGNRRFLCDELEHASGHRQNYFSAVLLPLFFGCLNRPPEERPRYARRLGRIPYLGGSLFHPSAFELRHRDLILPNGLVRHVFEETFRPFAFRFEPRMTDACIDPETLGRVLESLMAGAERAAGGSFSTPRDLADLLTDYAITAWLGPEPDAAALERITVLDPACGSGAFLLSALRVIARRTEALSGTPADLRRIAANCLFGVDLHQRATRLCELRLWLAIAAAEPRTKETIEPFPNLDRNILQGDSLLSPVESSRAQRREVYRAELDFLRRQRDFLRRYRTASHSHRPALLEAVQDIDRRIAAQLLTRRVAEAEDALAAAIAFSRRGGRVVAHLDLARCRALHARVQREGMLLARVNAGVLPPFSYDVHFAPILASGGFDVVLGNPPWVRRERIEASTRRALAERYPLFRGDGTRGMAARQADLAIAFMERGMALTQRHGVTAMLLPANTASAQYAAPFRRAIENGVVTIADWSSNTRQKPSSDAAATPPIGVVVRPHRVSTSVRVIRERQVFDLAPRDLAAESHGAAWATAPPLVRRILGRLRAAHPALADALGQRPMMGVKTGRNDAFFLAGSSISAAHLLTPDDIAIPISAVCRVVRGRDMRKWTIKAAHWMLWPPALPDGEPPWLELHARARGVSSADLRRTAYLRAAHVGLRVAWKDLSRGLAAAVMPETVTIDGQSVPLVPNQTLYSIAARSLDEAHAYAAILNSTIAGALLVAVAERAKKHYYRYYAHTVAALPWPNIDAMSAELALFSQAAHDGAEIGADLDGLVARAYGLTSDERRVLQEFLEEQLQ